MLLDGIDDLRGLDTARPGVRDLRRLEVGVYAIVMKALESPVAGSLHLRRPGEPRADLRRQVFQVLDQFGVRLPLIGDLLVGLLHAFAIGSTLFGGPLRGGLRRFLWGSFWILGQRQTAK